MPGITITPDIEYNGGSVTVRVDEYGHGDGTLHNSGSATFPNAGPSATIGGFDGQDGTREYAVGLDIQTPDATRSPAVKDVSLSVPNLAYRQHWRFDGIVLPGHIGPETTHTYGESYTLEIWLTGEIDTPESPWADHRARYDQLRRWQPHAGDLDTYESIGGRHYFREQHNTKPSLLVALRPPVNQNCGFGGYYLVTNVDDGTMTPEELVEMEFELLFIAGLDEFADEQAVRDELGKNNV